MKNGNGHNSDDPGHRFNEVEQKLFLDAMEYFIGAERREAVELQSPGGNTAYLPDCERRIGALDSVRRKVSEAFRLDHKHPCERESLAVVRSRRERTEWPSYFMAIAREVASRSTCDRNHVGAVIVRNKTILSTGYNGSMRGMPHCDDVGHTLENEHCTATVHAEANAIVQAAKNGVCIDGADIFTTASPCWQCFKLIANSGIKTVHFGRFYRDERIFEAARQMGIALVDMSATAEPRS